MSAARTSTNDERLAHPAEPLTAVPGIASEAIWLGASRGELPGQAFATLMGQRCPDWEPPTREFLERALMFDRLELAVRNERGQQKIAVELCSYQQTRF